MKLRGNLAAVLFAAVVGGLGCDGTNSATVPSAAQVPAEAFFFQPSPPVPEDVYWGQQGTFQVSGSTAVISTNPQVLELRPNGNAWSWRLVGPGVATIEVRRQGGVVLTHEVRSPLPVHDRHHVMLRAVLVTEEWTPFVERGYGGWGQGVPFKESPNLKYVEAVLWEGEGAVHVYEFDNSFTPLRGSHDGLSPEQYTAYRESFRVLAFPGMPVKPPDKNSSPELSRYLRETFKKITSYLVSRYPDSEHHLNYHGHGAAGGRLLEYRLMYDDVAEMLAHWTKELGRPLGVIDMGGPCNKSGYEDLTNFCRFAEYYVASDMPQGGYEFDEWTSDKHQETDADLQYHRLFGESEELRDVLTGRVNLKRASFEYSRNYMVATQYQQATYLYSCADFGPFAREFIPFVRARGLPAREVRGDVLDYIETNGGGAGLVEAYRRVVIHAVDNRDFFKWEENRNGMTMPTRFWWSERYP